MGQNSNSGLEFSLYPQHLGDLDSLESHVNEIKGDEGEDSDDDLHICGVCKIQFTSIEAFVHHKKSHHRSAKYEPFFMSIRKGYANKWINLTQS